MVETRYTGESLLDRMAHAVQKVHDRVRRVSVACEDAGIPDAIIGGNAVRIWVAQADEGAVRNTPDVDLLIDRDNLGVTIAAAEKLDFEYRELEWQSAFIDHLDGREKDVVNLFFTGEKVRPQHTLPMPTLQEVKPVDGIKTISLELLVLTKLTLNRRKDQVHIQDMIQVGLIDQTWTDRFDEPLKSRLQELLDDPYG